MFSIFRETSVKILVNSLIEIDKVILRNYVEMQRSYSNQDNLLIWWLTPLNFQTYYKKNVDLA